MSFPIFHAILSQLTAGVFQAASSSHWDGVRFKLTKGQCSNARLLAPRGFSMLAAFYLSPSILTSEVSELVQEWVSWPGRGKSSEEQGTLWYGRERKMWSDFCLSHSFNDHVILDKPPWFLGVYFLLSRTTKEPAETGQFFSCSLQPLSSLHSFSWEGHAPVPVTLGPRVMGHSLPRSYTMW